MNSLFFENEISYLNASLPLGISFYIFQIISYLVDVYRKKINAEKNILNYFLYVTFFPRLIAGPIERYDDFKKQLKEDRKISYYDFKYYFLLLLWGYFLKIVIADRLAIFVSTVYGDYANYDGFYLIIATILFAVQIYCDFYGYSTIALASAGLFGFKLTNNFDSPYLSNSVKQFWKKWHISLTNWFRDYVYIPLGGNKKGKFRNYLNILIVFCLSGLWHGSGLTYLIWGLLNGLYQILESLLLPKELRLKYEGKCIYRLISGIITFALIDFSWIFFKSSTLADSINIIKSIFSASNLNILYDGSLYSCGLDIRNFWFAIICIFILFIADSFNKKRKSIARILLNQNLLVQCLLFSLIITFILLFGIWGPSINNSGFIYANF